MYIVRCLMTYNTHTHTHTHTHARVRAHTHTHHTQVRLEELEAALTEECLSRQQTEGEAEGLRDQLAEAHESAAQLNSHVSELQTKWEECSVLLKEAQVSCVQSLLRTHSTVGIESVSWMQAPAELIMRCLYYVFLVTHSNL